LKNIHILVLVLLVSLFVGCTATKKKSEEDVRGFKKSMHDLNARFNGYHNAKVILTESFANLSRQHQDNYNQILSLYKESAVDDASSVAGQLDEAIKKSSIVISLHRVSKWTDNAYMVIGQSQYLKQEYDKSAETFMYVISEYDPVNIYDKEYKRLKRKRKKGLKRLKGDDLKEELTKKKYQNTERKNAMIWLARAKVDQGYHEDAQILIDKLLKDETLKKKQRVQLSVIDSYNSLKQGEYAESVKPLKEAIAITKRKKQKNRYVYILAQIYQMQGNDEEAAIAYKQVLKMRPDYPMEFRTRLNMIVNEWSSGKTNAKSAMASLTRMTKDIKNDEYQDQIYFAMANIAIKENQTDEAIVFLKQSLKFNTNNKPQKAESYLKLAEIYFEMEEFVFSKNYYDSTKQVMASKDPRYEIVNEYATNLTDIAANIEIVQKNDSLLRIKDMSPEERIALAKKIKKEQSLAESSKESVSQDRVSRTTPTPGAPKASSFFAYNENLLKKGKRDFEKAWGTRPLEDDWRRSVKSTGSEQAIASEVEEGASEVIVTSEEVEKIFADVPESAEDLEKLHAENVEALYALGELYREKLKNNRQSIAAFEELLARYPNNKYNVEAMYSLYILHQEEGNTALADTYKDQVIKGYPNSRHAKMILDPNASTEIEVADKEVADYYNQTFSLYQNEAFQEALNKINAADKVLGDANNIRPKFALLFALCTGSLQGKDDYINALGVVVKDYPDTDEARKANEYLSLLGGGTGIGITAKPGDDKPYDGRDKSSLFKDSSADQHYVIVVLSDSKVKIEKIKAALSDYNKKYNNLESFKISTLTLEIDPYIMIIRRFHNGDHAFKYANQAVSKKGEFLKNLDPNAKIYPLSQTNYKTVLRMREILPYLQYCERTYTYSNE